MKRDRQSRAWTVISIFLVMVWVAIFGWYFYQHMPIFQDEDGIAGTDMVEPGEEFREEWMGLYQGSNKIGYNHSLLYRKGQGYLLQDEMLLRIKLLGETRETRVSLDAHLGFDWSLRDFNIQALSEFMDFAAEGRVDGKQIKLKVKTAGQEVEQSIPVSQRPYLYTTWAFADHLKRQGLKEGLVTMLPMFDPVSRSFLPVELEVVAKGPVEIHGDLLEAFKIRERFKGQEQWLWLDKEGEVLKESHASGFMSLRETRDVALAFAEEGEEAIDLITSLLVKSDTAIINPRQVSLMKARLKNVSLKGLDLESDRQKLEGRTVTILSQQDRIPPSGYLIPFEKSFPEMKDEFEKYLGPDVSIQSSHPKIREAAEEAAGGLDDAVKVAARLTRWVSEEVKDSMVVSIPSALEVLEKKRGVCREHTVLYVALARALGIPARMAMGIVYINEQLIDGFYYHAWPEVYLAQPDGTGGLWIAVDPTFNQFPADATHIRLLEGGFEDVVELMAVIGQLEVEVEEYH
jgi:hypothetical protein